GLHLSVSTSRDHGRPAPFFIQRHVQLTLLHAPSRSPLPEPPTHTPRPSPSTSFPNLTLSSLNESMKDPSSSASSASNFHPGANIASAAGDAAQTSAMRNDSQPGSKSPERNSPQTSATASSAQSRSRDSIPTACLACVRT